MYTLKLAAADSRRALLARKKRRYNLANAEYNHARATRAIRAISIILVSLITLPAIVAAHTA